VSDSGCVVNLGPRETKRRLVPGLVAGLAGVALGVVAMQARWGLWPRLAALALIGFGALGILQAMNKT
jgi:hypothetical protein